MLLVFIGNLCSVGFIIDSSEDDYYDLVILDEVIYNVNIENQAAIVKVEEGFINNLGREITPRYYFPMIEGASAVMLRWFQNNQWYQANISASPQNPQGGPSSYPYFIEDYLGEQVPTIFDFPLELAAGDSIKVEFTYVQLLPYAFGQVNLFLKNKYTNFQASALSHQELNIDLVSDREITAYTIDQLGNQYSEIGVNQVHTHYEVYETGALLDYNVNFSLNQEELGLWSMSTYLDSVVDNQEHGFFTMIVEPDPSENTQVIDKVFTLIIDTSGSMDGNKIIQATDAASYIINNLNEGDIFNIISFSSGVYSLWDSHQEFNEANKQIALSYVSSLEADGSTNISGAFDLAVPQFNESTSDSANIIIFMTDGEQTAGITNTNTLISHIAELFSACDVPVYLFNFGIGYYTNEVLLSTTSNNHNGFATFLGNDQLYEVITEFYNMIRNPVMLNPEISISPANVLVDLHPISLPNLYKGKQMIISGRYSEPVDIEITFSGLAYGSEVSYQYSLTLADSSFTNYAFLPKVWAKQKIEDLLREYHTYPENSSDAQELKDEIIELSQLWGIITEFTSFSGDGVDNYDEELEQEQVEDTSVISLLGNYPNPFNPETTIRFEIKEDFNDIMFIKIYNLKGQLIKVLEVKVDSKGQYSVVWKGDNQAKQPVASGLYFYKIEYADHSAHGKMILMK
jgi:Ca-activated chloride channel family protein